MPYTVTIDPKRRRAVIEARGEVTGREIVAACADAFEHPDYAPGFSTLWIADGITSMLLEPVDLAALDAYAPTLVALRGAGRTAVVSASEDVELTALLFTRKTIRPDSKRESRVFTDRYRAEAWLEHRLSDTDNVAA